MQDYNSDEDTYYEPLEEEESDFSSSNEDYSIESTDQDDETERDSESDSMDE